MRHATWRHIAVLGYFLTAYTAAVAAPVAAPPAAPSAEHDGALMTWLGQEQDRQDIRDTLDRYFLAFDKHEYSLLNSVFTPGGKLYLSGQEVVDPGSNIAEKISDLIQQNPQISNVPAATDHYVQRVIIDLQGESAKVECYATAFLVVDEGVKSGSKIYVRGLRYFDDFVKVAPRQWRIRERRHNLEWMFKADATVGLALVDRKNRSD